MNEKSGVRVTRNHVENFKGEDHRIHLIFKLASLQSKSDRENF